MCSGIDQGDGEARGRGQTKSGRASGSRQVSHYNHHKPKQLMCVTNELFLSTGSRRV